MGLDMVNRVIKITVSELNNLLSSKSVGFQVQLFRIRPISIQSVRDSWQIPCASVFSKKVPLEAIQFIRSEGFMVQGGDASICALVDFGLVEGSDDCLHECLWQSMIIKPRKLMEKQAHQFNGRIYTRMMLKGRQQLPLRVVLDIQFFHFRLINILCFLQAITKTQFYCIYPSFFTTHFIWQLWYLMMFWMAVDYLQQIFITSYINMQRQRGLGRRNRQIMTRFDYYASVMNQQQAGFTNVAPQVKKREVDIGPSRFYHYEARRQDIRHFQLIDKDLLLKVATKHLKNGQSFKRQEKKTTKNEQEGKIDEEIDVFVNTIASQYSAASKSSTFPTPSIRKSGSQVSSSTATKNEQSDRYQIYIVHTTKQPTPQWTCFVQRLVLTHLKGVEDDDVGQITYEAMIGLQSQTGFLQSILKAILPQKNKNIATNHLHHFEQKITMFEKALIKQLKNRKLKNTEEEKIAHPQFKRDQNLPADQYQKYQRIKKEIYQYYLQINRQKKINHYFMDNLICRFMKFKQYDEEQSKKSIKNYLEWQKSIRQKYTYESFEEYHNMNLYEMIGRDKEGRVLLLFRPYNVYPDKIVDLNKYIDYTLYMLDIFIEDNTQGYIDEFILIADYGPFGSQHFKLSIAKEVADRAKELFPDRQYKLICFGLGTFSYYLYRIIKPFLPSYILDKTAIFGTDKAELKEFLSQHMNIDDLPPEILGQIQENINQNSSLSPTKGS